MQRDGCLLAILEIIGSIAKPNLRLGRMQIEPDLCAVLLALEQTLKLGWIRTWLESPPHSLN